MATTCREASHPSRVIRNSGSARRASQSLSSSSPRPQSPLFFCLQGVAFAQFHGQPKMAREKIWWIDRKGEEQASQSPREGTAGRAESAGRNGRSGEETRYFSAVGPNLARPHNFFTLEQNEIVREKSLCVRS